MSEEIIDGLDSGLIIDICSIIDSARNNVAKQVNTEITLMYWHIGERLNRELLGNERAAYGKRIVSQAATQLNERYGSNEFSTRNLRRMMQFSDEFPDLQIVSQLATKLFWSHFMEVLPIKDQNKREFYLIMAAREGWRRNLLRKQIDGMLYERTAISRKPEEMISNELAGLRDNDIMTPDLVFKDPYFLEFM